MGGYSLLPSFSQSSSFSQNAPGGPQAGALTDIFAGAKNAYDQNMKMGPYGGNYFAGSNPFLSGAYGQAGNFASGIGANVPGAQINGGLPLMAQGYGGAQGALSGLINYGMTDQTQNNINTANAYANNPHIQSLVDAAMDDGQRVAAEQTLPSLYRGAAASGNLNSDRTAIAEGVVKRGLGEMAAGMSAHVRGNMWNTGLNTALQQGQMGLGALSSGGSLGANLGGQGSGLLSQGITDQQNLSKLYEAAGSGVRDVSQNDINNQLAKYQGNQNFNWDALNKYYGIAGANNWWGTQNQNSSQFGLSPQQNPQSPGALGYIGAGLGALGSLAGLGIGGGGTLGGAALSGLFSRFGGPTGVSGGLGAGRIVPTY